MHEHDSAIAIMHAVMHFVQSHNTASQFYKDSTAGHLYLTTLLEAVRMDSTRLADVRASNK